jgi:hypothetical protein
MKENAKKKGEWKIYINLNLEDIYQFEFIVCVSIVSSSIHMNVY